MAFYQWFTNLASGGRGLPERFKRFTWNELWCGNSWRKTLHIYIYHYYKWISMIWEKQKQLGKISRFHPHFQFPWSSMIFQFGYRLKWSQQKDSAQFNAGPKEIHWTCYLSTPNSTSLSLAREPGAIVREAGDKSPGDLIIPWKMLEIQMLNAG